MLNGKTGFRNFSVSMVTLILVLSCSESNENKMIGKWVETSSGGGTEVMEFFEEGTVVLVNGRKRMTGRYSHLDESHVKLEFSGIGALAGPVVASYLFKDDHLIFTLPDGKVGRYRRIEMAKSAPALSYYQTPTDVLARKPAPTKTLRIGGLVAANSVRHGEDSEVLFTITDMKASIQVKYIGILPNLFREGQGAVVEGTISNDGSLIARSVLTKHDENYKPLINADTLQR